MENKKWSIGQGGNLPIGFGLSLAADSRAMAVFSAMSDEEKSAVVEQSRQQHTRHEMESFVSALGKRNVDENDTWR